MRVKVLLTGESASMLQNKQLLREKGVLVYSCDSINNINYLINELKPEVIFTEHPSYNAVAYYNIVNNEKCGNIPIVYKLDEEGVYVVACTGEENTDIRKNVVTNSLSDAIRTALLSTIKHAPQPYHFHGRRTINLQQANRA